LTKPHYKEGLPFRPELSTLKRLHSRETKRRWIVPIFFGKHIAMPSSPTARNHEKAKD
jgi:hypothetical protein